MSQIKTKKFGRHFELAKQKFNFSSRDPSNYTRARHARMVQFWLKIAHLSFSIATTPLLKMISSYGLRPRLWLLVEYATNEVSRPSFTVKTSLLSGGDKASFHWKHRVSLTSSEIKHAKHWNFD